MIDEEKICEILGVQLDRDRVYESKSWPNIEDFVVRDALKLVCGEIVSYGHGKPN